MPVQSTVKSSRLQLKFVEGTDGEGKEILKSSNVGALKDTATDDGIFQVASLVEALQDKPLRQISKITETTLTQI